MADVDGSSLLTHSQAKPVFGHLVLSLYSTIHQMNWA